MVAGSIWFLVVLSILFTLAIPLLIIWLLVVIARNVSRGPHGDRYDPAAEQLRMRFARGEITQAQFEDGMIALGYEKR